MSKTIEKPILDARELRVSQSYLYDGSIIKLDGSLLSMYLQNDTDLYLYPIPLTEDILVKFGFINEDDFLELSINEDLSIIWVGYLGIMIGGHISLLVDNDKMHQLQNLYFALTNQELEINL